ncbi:sugar phosphate isomerase/epimerase family protein [Pedococcus sp. NPDC057267]|uniref:sugar phosphate isomerase/epimerase family protein n=1 Tax=Pedococcus sp. NPDC057267 TaxID=3346077 RepID=UPI0036337F69
MTWPVFPLDTWFYHSHGSYSFEAKCEMVSDLGYDGICFTLWSEQSWADVPRFGTVQSQYGIDVLGVYAAVTGPDDEKGRAQVLELLRTVEGASNLELAVLGSPAASQHSDPAGDAAVLDMLEEFASVAGPRGMTISLYPHADCWLQTTEDAVRLVKQLDNPAVRVVFSGFHWFAVDGRDPQGTIELAAPYLASANLCGSRRGPNPLGMPATIEPIDSGQLDNFYLMGLLKKHGYAGPLGLQGYSIGGDPYPKLKHSIQVVRNMQRRLEDHPGWADLRLDPSPGASGADW